MPRPSASCPGARRTRAGGRGSQRHDRSQSTQGRVQRQGEGRPRVGAALPEMARRVHPRPRGSAGPAARGDPMKPVTVSITVPVGRDEVYDFLDVLANHEPFTNHMLVGWSYSGPERGVGARARMRLKKPGRADWMDLEVIEAVPPGEPARKPSAPEVAVERAAPTSSRSYRWARRGSPSSSRGSSSP